VELGGGAERNLMFLKLAKQFPKARLVFTGGSGLLLSQQDKAEDVARRLFQEQGLDMSRVLFEREARNTYENAVFSKKLVEPASDEKWVLITTAWHMPRSVGLFCKIGWPVIPYPVDHSTHPRPSLSIRFDFSGHLSGLRGGIREWVGLIAYYVTGKTTKLIPDICS